ncbi:MAG TPA: molybdopterin oxidoreductase [Ktedonobacter sp.]|jgi:anaerobic selenocysteine-containing dehydrogenase|nr:molybdopterin oxidoreductase [Ktedonobacter sp.]HAG98998.1 molybdopterin oxidoreductase [Ktedonobacter sp.]HAT45569.1 molybdopterin oxidoreductase [Ktedonobacter sp.]HBE26749.1 molybdopterin oxidoreductase [Ktedonobacter sp.]HCF85754.1 molybdopterin oxidoreductase [Ktedonobacter sp.]
MLLKAVEHKNLRVVYGACPHDCPDCCALETEVDEHGRAVSVRGRADHPVTRGWLCAKVNRYLERVYHPERILYPMRRVGSKGNGAFARISWEEAIAEITGRWRTIIAQHGAECILPYSYAGTLGMVNGAVTDNRFWNRLGACRLDRAICGHAAEDAVILTIGGRLAPSPEMLVHSKLVLIWGSNPASTAPHIMPFLRQAQRNGTRIIVIDPIRTLTARSADLHIQPYPGTDAALALALMHVMVTEELHHPEWIAAHTLGWEHLLERIMQFPPERAAGITGLTSETIVDLARSYATTTPALLRVTDGINRHTNGGQTVRTLACLPALTGQYGLPGGGLMYSTSDWLKWDRQAITHITDPLCPPAPRTLNMNRLGAILTGEADPPISSLFVYNANPVASSPNAGKIVEGLKRSDLFTIVHDLFETDTARYADILLPATSQLEHVDLHKPYGHLSLQYNMPAISPQGEARSNWDVMRTLAAGMGFDDPWLQEDANQVIRGVLEVTAQHTPLLAGITLERLQAEGSIPLIIPDDQKIPFADGAFRTPSGKVEFYSEQAAVKGYDPIPGWEPEVESRLEEPAQRSSNARLPLLCPAAHHFVSSTFGNQERMIAKEGAPTLRIHPLDAAPRGILDGQLVRVSNERGECQLVADVTEDVRPGVLATTTVWWPKFSPDQRNVNWTTSDRLADFNGGSTFYTNMVTVEALS